jgi:hypothetical protein
MKREPNTCPKCKEVHTRPRIWKEQHLLAAARGSTCPLLIPDELVQRG